MIHPCAWNPTECAHQAVVTVSSAESIIAGANVYMDCTDHDFQNTEPGDSAVYFPVLGQSTQFQIIPPVVHMVNEKRRDSVSAYIEYKRPKSKISRLRFSYNCYDHFCCVQVNSVLKSKSLLSTFARTNVQDLEHCKELISNEI